jgi:dTDP-4-amino-4,6-dideoxygalactose transaminase
MDVRAQYADLLDEVTGLVSEAVAGGRYVFGPNVRALEEELAAAVGAAHAVGVANGTDALVIALEALGVGPGDEVVTTAYTFYATAEAIARTGATPVFADIDPATYNLDPRAAEAAITDRTRAIVAVHIFGQPADMADFRDIADRHGIALVEDAAQAFGASCGGRRAGAWGDVATFSFYPTKNLPCMGDGGMVTSRSADLADRVRMLRFHGSRDKRRFELIGHNSRLDEIQAVVVRRFLREVDRWNDARRAVAARYRELGLGEHLTLPAEHPDRVHVYHLYVARTPAREALLARLKEAGVGAAVYYDVPLHRQPVFADLGYRDGQLPETDRLAREGIALPMFPTLSEAQAREVVEGVASAALAPA